MISISVIVPVYNVQSYLRECIESILDQTIDSFELILVDDGSTDESGRICDEYEEKDKRVRAIHKLNGGLSSARNAGLDAAKGDYICFIDSDDRVTKEYLEKLYGAVTGENADVAICDIEASRLTNTFMQNGGFARMDQSDAKRWLYDMRSREYVLMVIACNKLYSKELFCGIRYPVGRIHEDEFVIGQIIDRIHTAIFVDERLYLYRDNSFGITSKANRLNVRHLDAVCALEERIDDALKNGDRDFALITLKNALYKCAAFYHDAGASDDANLMSVAKEKYSEVLQKFGKLLSLKQKLKYRMFLVFPKLFICLYNP